MKSLMQKMTGKMMLSLSLVVSTSLNTGMDIHAQELSPRYLDTSLSFEERAADLVSRMTLEEKVSQMVTDADAIPRLGVPAYRWWSECLHGIARNGNATVFPMPIGLAATFDDDMVYKIANAISTEGRICTIWLRNEVIFQNIPDLPIILQALISIVTRDGEEDRKRMVKIRF